MMENVNVGTPVRNQPVVITDSGVARFVQNNIVRDLLDSAREQRQIDLNEIWKRAHEGKYTQYELIQFYQLIGYSVCGFWEVFGESKLGKQVGRWADKRVDALLK